MARNGHVWVVIYQHPGEDEDPATVKVYKREDDAYAELYRYLTDTLSVAIEEVASLGPDLPQSYNDTLKEMHWVFETEGVGNAIAVYDEGDIDDEERIRYQLEKRQVIG